MKSSFLFSVDDFWYEQLLLVSGYPLWKYKGSMRSRSLAAGGGRSQKAASARWLTIFHKFCGGRQKHFIDLIFPLILFFFVI